MSTKHRPTICFDFDGVIASYDGWKGCDVFGSPSRAVIHCMKALKRNGWYIVIWTTRPATQKLIDYLKVNGVPYHDINRNGHNPIGTSSKPIYDVFVDDRALNYKNQSQVELFREISRFMNVRGETKIGHLKGANRK